MPDSDTEKERPMSNEEKILAILEEHSKMFEKMQADISGLKAGQSAMQDDITGIKLRLELDVEKRFYATDCDQGEIIFFCTEEWAREFESATLCYMSDKVNY